MSICAVLHVSLHHVPFSRTHAKLFLGDQDSFHVNHIYKDDDTYSVVTAATEVLGEEINPLNAGTKKHLL